MVLRDTVWSDEKTLSVFILELEQRILSGLKKHLGPPLIREKECENFLSKYEDNNIVVSGPYIEEDRWAVEIYRKYTDVVGLLREKLEDGGRNVGVAELMSQGFKENLEVLVSSEVVPRYKSNKAFVNFLTFFLSGKPFWLKAPET